MAEPAASRNDSTMTAGAAHGRDGPRTPLRQGSSDGDAETTADTSLTGTAAQSGTSEAKHEDAHSPGGRGWSRARTTAAIALSLACAAATALCAIFGSAWAGDRSRESDRAAALAAGKTVAADLATISFTSARADIDRVVAAGTGDFANQFRANVDSYTDVLRRGEIATTGSVTEAGLDSVQDGKARAVVALASKVRSKASPQGEDRSYRMSVDLQRQGDGRWLASRVDFVP